MALLNSLFAGVSGLKNHQSMMDVIGNNIANVNTIGYKGSRVTFSDAFNNLISAGTNPTETTGGTNSFQIGLGMKINSIDRNWNQGTFERTGITTDLALQGKGMFVLNSDGQRFYSRSGAFQFDADGKLVSTQNGAIVQGKMASDEGVIPPGNNLEDIQIDTNLKLPATATSEIKWGGNLKSNSSITRTETVLTRGNIKSTDTTDTVIENVVYNEYGEAFTLKQTFHPTGTANEYEMDWELEDSSGTTVTGSSPSSPLTLQFVDDGSGSYVLDATSKALFEAASTSNVLNVSSAGNPSGEINFRIDASQLTNNDATKTISSSADQNREPNIVSGSVTVYDSLGSAHQVTLQYTKIDANQWRFVASVPGTSTSTGSPSYSTGTIEFNSDGTLDSSMISPNDPYLSFTPAAGANPVSINLNFGDGFNGITQTSSSSVVSAINQNGSASATLSDVNIDQYGNIEGIFSNGNSRVLAQIMVATFNNLNGLISEGGNLYTAYANAGDPYVAELGEDSNTTLQSGALEQSNVDLSEEFTKMIVSQRGFQANARVITTADSLLQEITNLIR